MPQTTEPQPLQKVDLTTSPPAVAKSSRRPHVVSLELSDRERADLEKREWEGVSENRAHRLAFEADPSNLGGSYSGLYRIKPIGVPYALAKSIAVNESLVASVVLARQHHMAPFGREQADRHKIGFKIGFRDDFMEGLEESEKAEWEERARRASKLLRTCGRTDGLRKSERCSLGTWLKLSVKSALVVGSIATELIFDENDNFHRFRAVDAGSIYPIDKSVDEQKADQVRERSEELLRRWYGDPDLRVPRDEQLDHQSYWATYDWNAYEWVQVINGTPRQVFTEEQLVVSNFYPTPDMEWQGFPCTPIDTATQEILTRLSITAWNKVYFQNGRAAKGMIVIKSDDVDASVIMQIRQAFMASINGVQSAWRMPVFGVSQEDEIVWQPIDSSSRDMEFQYLSDNNARCILSAFQMSPEELPGFAHLSKGTNSQALSESRTEYVLEAHRDTGIRQIIANFEDFLNDHILELLDPELAKVARVELRGLDALTPDEEDAAMERLQQIDGSINDVLSSREKRPLPKELAGDVPLNQVWGAVAQAFVPVGVIMENMLGVKGASKDPRFQYLRDPFYWQAREDLMGQLQMVLQPPLDVMAPLVLPGLLAAIFGVSPEQAAQAAQAVLQAAQQQAQLAAQQAAQGGGQQGAEPAQKSEWNFLKNRHNFLAGAAVGSAQPPGVAKSRST